MTEETRPPPPHVARPAEPAAQARPPQPPPAMAPPPFLPPGFTAASPPPQAPPPQMPPQMPPPYGYYPPPYGYYPPPYGYYPNPYMQQPPAPPKPLEPRQLRTAQGLDIAVFGVYVLAAAFLWSALIGAIAVAALLPTMNGRPQLGATEAAWLNGVMVARVIVWVMFLIAAILLLAAMSRFHEGRAEFGPEHERKNREMQTSAALFTFLVGGSGVVVLILTLNPASPIQGSPLRGLQDSLRLTAIVWGITGAVSAFLLSRSFIALLRPFVPAEKMRALRVVPVVMLFVPLFHAGLSISFSDMAAIDTGGLWNASTLRAAAEAGGLAGVASALPLIVLVRALRAAHNRVVAGIVPSVVIRKPAA